MNPILRGMYPDPSVCRVDGTYYLVTSTFEYLPGLPIHASTDLETWTLVGHAATDQFDFSGVGDSRGMFAPTIRFHDGLFYIACTLMRDDGQNFYVTATDAAGPWSSPTFLPDARGIDPSLFFDADGRAWCIGCREVVPQSFDGETEIWMRELDLERGELVGPESIIFTRTMYRAVWAEGPHIYERDGWFYLVTAEGGTAFEHSVMVARSRDLAGPYLPSRINPIITHRHLAHGAEVQYVGHADMFEGDDGQWWAVMLAVRPIDGHHVLGRETHLARVTWEDGWPVVNAGTGVLDAPVPAPGSWGSDSPSADDFLGVRRLPSLGDGALLRRLTSTDSTISVTLDEVTGAAGLMIRQSDDATVRLEVTDATVSLLDRGTTIATAPLPPGPITLAATITPQGIAFSHGLGTIPLSAISTESAGGFVGATFGPYGSARFLAWTQVDRS